MQNGALLTTKAKTSSRLPSLLLLLLLLFLLWTFLSSIRRDSTTATSAISSSSISQNPALAPPESGAIRPVQHELKDVTVSQLIVEDFQETFLRR